jgi:predicted ester cyclase
MPAMEALGLVTGMKAAFPDLKFDVQQVTVNGNQATVKVQLSGTNTGTLSMPLPGMPSSIPPTGKKVSVPDAFVVTVQGDKVSQMQVVSPADGGLPAVLAEIGVKMPG